VAPVAAPCKQRRARHDSGHRRATDIRYVVIHDTEGGTASSNAAWFASPASAASTQLVVDDRECYRCLPDLVIPWGAPGANTHGLHIEHAGFAHWTRRVWLEHSAMLERSAYKTARWCWQYRLPRRWLTVAQLRRHERGFCTHAQASAAFPPNDGHSDPGAHFPKDLYMRLVRKHYAAIVKQAKAREAT
jgi:hypothetical protein